ncbi:hypothetical protein ZHAS_00021974 [Anopheles sinensis]|uniref:Uncharacterized protein n=1 Tax=Anopheles sinensis TaxID=74873 RepID=A0A084WTC3_ANOSI|nr:hypothetical protein ZHAS_00021974 [Anopheles sinensis]
MHTILGVCNLAQEGKKIPPVDKGAKIFTPKLDEAMKRNKMGESSRPLGILGRLHLARRGLCSAFGCGNAFTEPCNSEGPRKASRRGVMKGDVNTLARFALSQPVGPVGVMGMECNNLQPMVMQIRQHS